MRLRLKSNKVVFLKSVFTQKHKQTHKMYFFKTFFASEFNFCPSQLINGYLLFTTSLHSPI